MTNEQRDRMLAAVWGETSGRIKKHVEGYWAEHSVTCFGCGKTATDSQRTKTEIRKQLRQEGWKVSVQGWDYKRLDFCGQECFENSFEKLGEEYHRAEQMERVLADFVPSSKPNDRAGVDQVVIIGALSGSERTHQEVNPTNN